MKYLLVGDDFKRLFIEDDDGFSTYYNQYDKIWYPGGTMLNDARVGFDSSEPEDSPYRYGNTSCMLEIVEITLEEAEKFIHQKFDKKLACKILKQIKGMAKPHIYDW